MFIGVVNTARSFNGMPMKVTDIGYPEGARTVGQKSRFDKTLADAVPKMDVIERHWIVYRMAHGRRHGRRDDAVRLEAMNGDVAAGAAIVAAGGTVSDMWGGPLRFNNENPRVESSRWRRASCVLLTERTKTA